jgi:hypothetical protein
MKEIPMKKTFRFVLSTLAVFTFTLAFASLAQAQATRTWVSGVGDDVNPCSRTAPCKTFAGAISKTFINGEIDALDPGGYGTVAITKSITLDGGTGSGWASILSSGTSGVTVNLTVNVNDPQKTVRLRHLSINGTGSSGAIGTRTGVHGVNISINSAAGTTVIVQEVLIDGFTQNGINATFGPSGGNLVVEDSYIQECAKGILVSATGAFGVASVRNTRLQRNGTGMEAAANGFGTIEDCNSSLNTGDAFKASASPSALSVSRSVMAHNNGVGLNASVAGATIRALSNQILSNGTGINAVGTVSTDGQNRNAGNGVPGAPNGGLVTIQ